MARDSQFMPRQARPNEAYLRAQLLFQHAPIDACQTDPGCMIIHDRPAAPKTSSSAADRAIRRSCRHPTSPADDPGRQPSGFDRWRRE
jgi:hypothetical protein